MRSTIFLPIITSMNSKHNNADRNSVGSTYSLGFSDGNMETEIIHAQAVIASIAYSPPKNMFAAH